MVRFKFDSVHRIVLIYVCNVLMHHSRVHGEQEVKECHLIANESLDEPLSLIKSSEPNNDHVIDIKDDIDNRICAKSETMEVNEATIYSTDKEQTVAELQNDKAGSDVSSQDEAVDHNNEIPLDLNHKEQLDNTSSIYLEEGTSSHEDTKAEPIPDSLQPPVEQQQLDNTNPVSTNAAGESPDALSPQQPENTVPLSLYEVDDPYIDDDDNPYSALCIPCSKDIPEMSTAATPQSQPQSIIYNESRLVPPTCAICLIHYEPGCYVTWSQKCIHVFHRDCILMWLLKKDEPLCPCCRQEFVDGIGNRRETDSLREDLEAAFAG